MSATPFTCVKYFTLYSVVQHNSIWWIIIGKRTDPDTGKRIVTLDNRLQGSIELDGETAVQQIASPLETAHSYCYAQRRDVE